MSARALPLDAHPFVRRLLATEVEDARCELIARHELAVEEARDIVRQLLDEAERLIGADPRRMERVCLDALALARRAGDDFLWAMARFKHGESCALQYRHAEARGYLDEAAATFTRLGCPVEAARTRIIWVWSTSQLGDNDEALATARAARRVLAAYGQTLRVATLDYNVGIIHTERARYRTALRYFGSALKLYQSLGDAGRVALAHQARGLTLARLGRYREAFPDLERARDTQRRLGVMMHEAMTIRAIGETHLGLGRYAAALHAFEEAQPLFRELDNHSGSVWLARDTADCYLHLNRPADALTVLAEADGHLRHDDSVADQYACAVRRIGAYLLLHDRAGALAVLDDVERRFPNGGAHDQHSLAVQRAVVLLSDGASAEALVAARHARALHRATGLLRPAADASLIEGSALLDLGCTDEAARAAARARRTARALDAAPLLHRVYELLGRIAEKRNRTSSACRYYTAAIRQLEREQQGVIFEFRDSFAAGRGLAYERLASLQLDAGRPADALATAERAKSRALADAIAGNVELRPRGTAGARRLVRELTAAREDYAAACAWLSRREDGSAAAGQDDGAVPDLSELEHRIDDLVRRVQIAGAGVEAADLYGAAPDVTLPTLAPDTSLIEFFFSGDDILRFQVDCTGVHGDRLAAAVPTVERLLRAFRLNLDATERSPSEERGRLAGQARAVLGRLHDVLLTGMTLREDCRSLVVVPHGMLHYLPFHALYDGERYLVERVAVSYAPSVALYEVCRVRARRPSRHGAALVLAHSSGGRLPYTLDEAVAVGEVLGAAVHREAAATRALLETAGRRAGIIHIAAHGQFRPDAPLFSRVELADGPLTTVDVFNLDLRAALVALSACETGRAVLGGGDELAGLTRAFLYAGAAGLLVSQWRVDDAATTAFMTRFYQQARRSATVGHAPALRAAQIACIHEGGMNQNGGLHPFFWAGFQIIGV